MVPPAAALAPPRCRFDQRQRYALRDDGERRKRRGWDCLQHHAERLVHEPIYLSRWMVPYALLDVQGLLYGTTASGGSFKKGNDL